jgi:hypothetical protein
MSLQYPLIRSLFSCSIPRTQVYDDDNDDKDDIDDDNNKGEME